MQGAQKKGSSPN